MPVPHGEWWYLTRMIEGQAYPIYCRGRSMETAGDEVLLDLNVEAAGHEYFDVAAADPSPAHDLMAWSSDVDGASATRCGSATCHVDSTNPTS